MNHQELFDAIFNFVTNAGKLTGTAQSAYGATRYELNGVAATWEDDGSTRGIYIPQARFHDTCGNIDFAGNDTKLLEKIYNSLCLGKSWTDEEMTDLDWLAYFIDNYPNSDLVGTLVTVK